MATSGSSSAKGQGKDLRSPAGLLAALANGTALLSAVPDRNATLRHSIRAAFVGRPEDDSEASVGDGPYARIDKAFSTPCPLAMAPGASSVSSEPPTR